MSFDRKAVPVSGYCRNCDRQLMALVPSTENPNDGNPPRVRCSECGGITLAKGGNGGGGE